MKWFGKRTAKVVPEGLAKRLSKWEQLLGKKSAKGLKAELDREAERDAATRKKKRGETGGRRRRTRRHRR